MAVYGAVGATGWGDGALFSGGYDGTNRLATGYYVTFYSLHCLGWSLEIIKSSEDGVGQVS